MLALTFTCEVPIHRLITLQLPDSIEPGPHEVTLVVNEREPASVAGRSEPSATQEFAAARMAALEKARARLGGLLSSSDEFAARKREEIELEERKFAR